jgi:hypothetical protein
LSFCSFPPHQKFTALFHTEIKQHQTKRS